MKLTTATSHHATAATAATALKNRIITGLALILLLLVPSVVQSQSVLGPFRFDSTLFGNTLTESDGGILSSSGWLNTVNVNPGNPRYLTGADFETGIANIGPGRAFTIGYNSPILNGAGADLGIVVARFSSDDLSFAVSTDGGMTFTSDQLIRGSTAQDSGATRGYFYGNYSGVFTAQLFVHPIDLESFGLAIGAGVDAVRITSPMELDLIRVAGFKRVPEPSTLSLVLAAAPILFALGRKGSCKP